MSRCTWVDPQVVFKLEVQRRVALSLANSEAELPDLGRLERSRCPDLGIWKIIQADQSADYACDAHLPILLKDGAEFYAVEIEECRSAIFRITEEHQPSYIGPRKLGYKQCMVCDTQWPCLAVRAATFVVALQPVYPVAVATEGSDTNG